MHNDELKQMAAVTALARTLDGDHFNIDTVNQVGVMLGVLLAGPEYRILCTLHGIHYADMPVLLVEALPDLIEAAVGVKALDLHDQLDGLYDQRILRERADATARRQSIRRWAFGWLLGARA